MNSDTNPYQKTLAPFHIWLSSRNLAEETLMKYNLRVSSYLQFCGELNVGPAHSCGEALVEAYMKHLFDSAAGTAKINQSISAISNYFEFNQARFPQIERLNYIPRPHPCLSEAEILRLLDVLKSTQNTKALTIIMLCFCAGLTSGDCARLNLEDIRVEDGCRKLAIQRTGKIVELSMPAQLALARWLLNWSSAKFTGPLFPNCFGGRISRVGVDYLIRSVGIQANLMLSARRLSRAGKEFGHLLQ